jgi:hypothetical protein
LKRLAQQSGQIAATVDVPSGNALAIWNVPDASMRIVKGERHSSQCTTAAYSGRDTHYPGEAPRVIGEKLCGRRAGVLPDDH